ncbi:unnamed protein product [Somion occarium]|uniref:Protein kinase domain-containing protein n=1 Tax=Somion occarium TaxID=3059160 RepID=A0ABP1D722_9APHY
MPESLFLYGIESAEKYAAAGGGYSDIFRATVGSNPVALKRLRIFQHSRALEDTYSDLCREALVWQQLKHPFILPFLGLERDIFKPYYCIVTPWMPLGNINQFIDEELQNDSKDPLPLERWLIETARGLRYLHGEHVVHGDIRGANILIGSDKHIRLADFGMSHFADSSSASLGSCSAGAVRWVAPEVLQGARLSYENDIYAYGCFWVEMYTRRRPFFDIPHDFQVVARKLVDGQPAWPSKAGHPRITLNPNNWEFVKSCWADDPSKRPAAAGLAALCLARLYDTTDSTEPISHGHGISRRRSEPFGRRSLAHDVCDNVSIGDSLKSSPGAARPLESSILANASPHFIGAMSSSPFSFVSGALSGPSRCSPSESATFLLYILLLHYKTSLLLTSELSNF